MFRKKTAAASTSIAGPLPTGDSIAAIAKSVPMAPELAGARNQLVELRNRREAAWDEIRAMGGLQTDMSSSRAGHDQAARRARKLEGEISALDAAIDQLREDMAPLADVHSDAIRQALGPIRASLAAEIVAAAAAIIEAVDRLNACIDAERRSSAPSLRIYPPSMAGLLRDIAPHHGGEGASKNA